MIYWLKILPCKIKKDDVTNTLSAIEREKQQLIAAIYNKGLERAWRTDQIVSNVSKFIVQHPEVTITHLQETQGKRNCRSAIR